jgi:uncharacterized glyoxalase superfamily protein PhnB
VELARAYRIRQNPVNFEAPQILSVENWGAKPKPADLDASAKIRAPRRIRLDNGTVASEYLSRYELQMALKYLDSLILYSSNLSKTVEFYTKLGLPLEHEDHGSGPVHYACELQGAHIAIFESKPGDALKRGFGGATQFGLQVDSVDETFQIAIKAGAKVIIEPQSAPWGKRAIIEDPDGRPLELNQAPK